MLLYVSIRIPNALDLLGIFVRDLDIEFLFETHNELNQIKRIRAKVLDKPGIFRNFRLIDTKLVKR